MPDQLPMTKTYANNGLTIVWKPDLCIHAGNCARGLPNVFQSREKPWIRQHEAYSQQIVDQIGQCPSGALSYYNNQNIANGK